MILTGMISRLHVGLQFVRCGVEAAEGARYSTAEGT